MIYAQLLLDFFLSFDVTYLNTLFNNPLNFFVTNTPPFNFEPNFTNNVLYESFHGADAMFLISPFLYLILPIFHFER